MKKYFNTKKTLTAQKTVVLCLCRADGAAESNFFTGFRADTKISFLNRKL